MLLCDRNFLHIYKFLLLRKWKSIVININQLYTNKILLIDNLSLNTDFNHIFYGAFLTVLVPLIKPVLLAAIRPTF